MAKPSKQQVKAVRAVLYQRARLRRLQADLSSIEVLMNLNNPSQPSGAPLWTIPATGQPSGALTEALDRSRRVVATLREMGAELGRLGDVPDGDRQALRTMLGEQAAAWEARALVWAAPGRPDVEAEVARIAAHQEKALRAQRRASRYLRAGSLEEEAA